MAQINPKDYVGLNQKLYLKRKELKLSIRRAKKKAKMTSVGLYLREHGYIKISDTAKQKFAKAYELSEDFFDDTLLYPTVVDGVTNANVDLNRNTKRYKFRKMFSSWIFKLVTGVITGVCVFLVIYGNGFYQRIYTNPNSFYSTEVNTVRGIAQEKGILIPAASEGYVTANLTLDSYYSIRETVKDEKEESTYTYGVNFFEEYENMDLTFLGLMADKKLDEFDGKANAKVSIQLEGRTYGDYSRYHFYIFDYSRTDLVPGYHVVADYDIHYNARYRVVEYETLGDKGNIDPSLPIYDELISVLTYEVNYANRVLFPHLFEQQVKTDPAISFAIFMNHLWDDIDNLNQYAIKYSTMVICGAIFAVIFLALFVLSFVVQFSYKKLRERIENHEEDVLNDDSLALDNQIFNSNKVELEESNKEEIVDTGNVAVLQQTGYKPLPKNRFIGPIIPEFLIRLFTIGCALFASLFLIALFVNVIELNIFGIVDTASSARYVGVLSTISMLMVFFLVVDTNSRMEKNFNALFTLFFTGLLYYVVCILISTTLSLSNNVYKVLVNAALDLLPGNLIWGILCFRLMTTFLFTTPQSFSTSKKKVIIFRLLAILPAAYLITGVIINSNSSWNVPFYVKSLFFSKGFLLTAFAVMFCLALYFFNRYLIKKYGPDGFKVFKNGNRYIYLRNLIVAGIVLILGLLEVIGDKYFPINPLKIGNNVYILYTIPLILLYHPHFGKRNSILDTLAKTIYVVCLSLGAIYIIFYLGELLAMV